jgi:hypothetical protein
MTQKERRQLIELGILTEDCGPSISYWKLSPQVKREARRRMNERERMAGGLLLARILERLKELKKGKEEQDDRKRKTTIIGRVGNMEARA